MFAVDVSVLGAMHFDSGIAMLNANQHGHAIEQFDQCLAYTPNYTLAHWYKSLALFALGDYERGFREHRHRWTLCDWGWGLLKGDVKSLADIPVWCGEPVRDKSVLFQFEQGFGDSIMMLRYIPVLKRLGARVSAFMPDPLARLVVQQYGVLVHMEPPRPTSCHYRLPMFDVMLPLRQTPKNIPGGAYIKPKAWERNGGKIGIVWSGRSRRELSLAQFLAPLGSGYKFYSLSPALCGEGVEPCQSVDFADTVELIAQMDHVVTVDTSVVHLAGAMGHPSLHVILPLNQDWRWYHAKAWYPFINVYRQQTADDWHGPLAAIRSAIGDKDNKTDNVAKALTKAAARQHAANP